MRDLWPNSVNIKSNCNTFLFDNLCDTKKMQFTFRIMFAMTPNHQFDLRLDHAQVQSCLLAMATVPSN